MRLYTKLFVASLAATALFASLAGSASANRFSISNRNIRTVFTPLVFTSSLGQVISCTVTMEGSFHSSTISKVVNSLIGYITRATVNTPGCRNTDGIQALVRQETLPWHIRYNSFIGTLPNVRIRIQLMNAGFDLLNVPFLGVCRFTASPFGIIEGPVDGSNINTGNAFVRAEGGQEFPSSTPFCPSGRFSGRAAATLLNTVTPITVRLI